MQEFVQKSLIFFKLFRENFLSSLEYAIREEIAITIDIT